jgi:hypothetical protein
MPSDKVPVPSMRAVKYFYFRASKRKTFNRGLSRYTSFASLQ